MKGRRLQNTIMKTKTNKILLATAVLLCIVSIYCEHDQVDVCRQKSGSFYVANNSILELNGSECITKESIVLLKLATHNVTACVNIPGSSPSLCFRKNKLCILIASTWSRTWSLDSDLAYLGCKSFYRENVENMTPLNLTLRMEIKGKERNNQSRITYEIKYSGWNVTGLQDSSHQPSSSSTDQLAAIFLGILLVVVIVALMTVSARVFLLKEKLSSMERKANRQRANPAVDVDTTYTVILDGGIQQTNSSEKKVAENQLYNM